jgi:hypothetical protein
MAPISSFASVGANRSWPQSCLGVLTHSLSRVRPAGWESAAYFDAEFDTARLVSRERSGCTSQLSLAASRWHGNIPRRTTAPKPLHPTPQDSAGIPVLRSHRCTIVNSGARSRSAAPGVGVWHFFWGSRSPYSVESMQERITASPGTLPHDRGSPITLLRRELGRFPGAAPRDPVTVRGSAGGGFLRLSRRNSRPTQQLPAPQFRACVRCVPLPHAHALGGPT